VTLSLTLIVRDEAEMTPGFLEAVQGLGDELVVVDTGSLDETRRLFEAAGARVFTHPWSNDFAEARNVALAHATGDWVLVLDADERPSPGFAAELAAAMADPTVGACTVRMRNQLPYGHSRESRVLRVFRREGARFEHAIHEDASASVRQGLATRGQRAVALDAPIEHLGYVRSRAAARHKKDRDLALLRRCLEADPADFYSRLKLLELARFWRDEALGREEARLTQAELALHPRALADAPWGGELLALASECLFAADSEQGLKWLSRAGERTLPSAALSYRLGQIHEARAELLLAEAAFTRCLALGDQTGDLQLVTVRPLLGLARLAIFGQNLAQARDLTARALEGAPLDPEALLSMASLTLATGGVDALRRFEAEHTQRCPACPERDWAIGEALYATGDFAGAVQALRSAAGVPPAGPQALTLAQALLAAGQLTASEELVRALVWSEPEAGLGVLLFDLLAGRDSALELELSEQAAHRALRAWVVALKRSGRRELIEAVGRRAGAVAGLFPWLPGELARAG
jgi:tetratricopeptide (TPR) repeat protein